MGTLSSPEEKRRWSARTAWGGYRSGTGDVFGAILAADLVNGVPLEQSVRKAAAFITKTILYTQQLGVPETDGICFEEYLWELGRDTKEVAT